MKKLIAITMAVVLLLAMMAFPAVATADPGPHDDGYITLDDTHTSLHYWDAGTVPNAWAWNYDDWYLTIATTGNALVKIEWFDWYPTNDVYELWVDGALQGTNPAGGTGTWQGWLSKGVHQVRIDWIYYQTNKPLINGGSYYDIKFTVLAQTIPLNIDIKPGSDPNSINPGEQGVLPVAILGSSIDVSTIDLSKPITLGGAAVTSRGSAKAPKLAVSFEDVDGDGLMDLVAFFRVQDLVDSGALDETTTQLKLEAETTGGMPISGIDLVRIVPP